MYMSDHEISYDYRHARHKTQMIGILAELNGVSRPMMEYKLRRMGLLDTEYQDNRRRLDYNRMYELYNQGMSDREIASSVGCCACSVSSWRERYNLLPNF